MAWADVDAFWKLRWTTLTLLADFSGDNGDGMTVVAMGSGSPGGVATALTAIEHDASTLRPPIPAATTDVVVALPARYENGNAQPAQLLYLLSDVPDTLLLQEATS